MISVMSDMCYHSHSGIPENKYSDPFAGEKTTLTAGEVYESPKYQLYWDD